jgi:CelD/BcsL family acetyltransferase involved in cellulose biosynthesis
MHRDLVVESHGWTRWPELTAVWSALAGACEHASFFLMPEAVGSWLDVFGPRLEPSLLVFRDPEQTVVGAAILVRRTVRKGPFAVRRIYLNTAGEDDADSACIEFNGLLCHPGHEVAVARALRTHVDREPWDELAAPGMLDGASLRALNAAFADATPVAQTTLDYYVSLADVRRSGKDFVEQLAARERTRYRQNVRKYSALGELALEEATTTTEALDYLADLANLHQKTWTSRGAPGSFASQLFCDYHRRLIENCFPLGWIQLLRLRAGATTIGYHYAFLFGGRSYFYQCGYDYELGEKTAPGVIVHTFAIRHAAKQGLTEYDFLAGDVEYKRRLATGSRAMHWMSWRAPSLKMLSFRLAHDAKQALRTPLKRLRAAIRPQPAAYAPTRAIRRDSPEAVDLACHPTGDAPSSSQAPTERG